MMTCAVRSFVVLLLLGLPHLLGKFTRRSSRLRAGYVTLEVMAAGCPTQAELTTIADDNGRLIKHLPTKLSCYDPRLLHYFGLSQLEQPAEASFPSKPSH